MTGGALTVCVLRRHHVSNSIEAARGRSFRETNYSIWRRVSVIHRGLGEQMIDEDWWGGLSWNDSRHYEPFIVWRRASVSGNVFTRCCCYPRDVILGHVLIHVYICLYSVFFFLQDVADAQTVAIDCMSFGPYNCLILESMEVDSFPKREVDNMSQSKHWLSSSLRLEFCFFVASSCLGPQNSSLTLKFRSFVASSCLGPQNT